MGESISHIRLVQRIVQWLTSEIPECDCLCVFRDLPDARSQDKTPCINGFFPDVFAEDTPPTFTLVGEAKTAEDLETEHSKRQLRAYLAYLKLRPRPRLIVSTPWFAVNSAKSLIAAAQEDVEATSVAVSIIHC
jgi:hypothetical protein